MRRRFLYYLPNRPGCSDQILAEAGLYGRFVGGPTGAAAWCARKIENGPDGLSGALVARGSRPPDYQPDKQAWLRDGGICFGLEDKTLPPGPSDLIRETGIEGHEVLFGDGHNWLVPCLQKWNAEKGEHELNVPTSFIKRDGKLIRETPAAFQPLVKISKWAFAGFCGGKEAALADVCEDVANLLAMNYRVDLPECGLLGLFNAEAALAALGASFDLPALNAAAAEAARRGLQFHDVAPE